MKTTVKIVRMALEGIFGLAMCLGSIKTVVDGIHDKENANFIAGAVLGGMIGVALIADAKRVGQQMRSQGLG
jgi:hypothetical protein